ncbi:hypothetical protein Acr_07g0005460 [Actinidia rufa]|uniref:Uncharacterized protein n=1 Tax=Actinidia rufa TaxID=165716 RepID=A0A7J0EWJ9_9ERIC|nr:hypothetical protein Acr_07g0005460 [Actinidia rufa]
MVPDLAISLISSPSSLFLSGGTPVRGEAVLRVVVKNRCALVLGEKVDQETSKTGNAKTEDNGSHAKTVGDGTHTINPKSQAHAVDSEPERRPNQPNHSSLPSNEVGSENQTKSKKESKERTKEGKTLESDGVNKALQDKAEDEKPATDKFIVSIFYDLRERETDWLLPTTETGTENGVKPKKRRKETVAEGKSLEGGANYNNVLREDQVKQNEVGSAKSGNDHSIRSELDQKSIKGLEGKNVEIKPSQGRTLSNGLIIDDVEMGKLDGKIAAPGKKVCELAAKEGSLAHHQ